MAETAPEYCSTMDVTKFFRPGEKQGPFTLAADSTATKITLSAADAGKFTPGDVVWVKDTAQPGGERATVSAVTYSGASSFLTVAGLGIYAKTASAECYLLSDFAPDTQPSVFEVLDLIAEAEDEIDEFCHTSWKATTVTEESHHRLHRKTTWLEGHPINLNNRHIVDFTSGTDKIEVWNGSQWVDWVSTKTEGRANEFWVDYNLGIIFLKSFYFWHSKLSVRVTYRYQTRDTVPKDVKKAAAMKVAMELITSDVTLANISTEAGGQDHMGPDPRVGRYARAVKNILSHHEEVLMFYD